MDAPNLLVDVAMKSPFKSWRHSHIFTQLDENTGELKDVVEHTPLLRFIGSLFYFRQSKGESMFDYRDLITQELQEEIK